MENLAYGLAIFAGIVLLTRLLLRGWRCFLWHSWGPIAHAGQSMTKTCTCCGAQTTRDVSTGNWS